MNTTSNRDREPDRCPECGGEMEVEVREFSNGLMGEVGEAPVIWVELRCHACGHGELPPDDR